MTSPIVSKTAVILTKIAITSKPHRPKRRELIALYTATTQRSHRFTSFIPNNFAHSLNRRQVLTMEKRIAAPFILFCNRGRKSRQVESCEGGCDLLQSKPFPAHTVLSGDSTPEKLLPPRIHILPSTHLLSCLSPRRLEYPEAKSQLSLLVEHRDYPLRCPP